MFMYMCGSVTCISRGQPINGPSHRPTREARAEEGACNYERYRTLVKSVFTGLSEAEALARIDVEEMYPRDKKRSKKEKQK